ncbi:NAD(P)H-dependent oxidoreductase [Photobacterium aphoticum]|uniref:1-deoxy-D-xylulose 5-phosphate synthase n=1 Tax=Photobacterium aphoticum TaxID=754436 RepID=A0A090R4Q7_9GAMM|nr:NAD(P)H-dependent oxidoreductase [Photobacterium aphoticum]KLV01807.1 flavin reductase [Photobacterium aphoticum]PSU58704.1 NAD(P)H-dependent oxidoreductase [Photobacterium aphoticum]GAL02632.1 1-deoxy-D-xylulose 5-phosphate synthase [Photobacterium aphoticum]GHA32622.1 NAD(P)H-dependent oxidoreductase [Photobacterium aphoticum]
MSHPIIKDLNTRYTAKKYDEAKRISADDMAVIKEALRMSASSINSQPWKFVIVESDEAKQRFHDTFENMHQFNQPHAKAASHTILFAYDPNFTKEKFAKRVDAEVTSGHLPADMYDMFMGAYAFAEANTDDKGFNGNWTKAQVYIALGNILHTLARLGIDSTPMEGVDPTLIGEKFAKELDGHVCELALAIGYHKDGEDYNHGLPKARLAMDDVLVTA